MLAAVVILSTGCSGKEIVGDVPSGKSCSENIAYLQSGVDRYFESFGNYPASVNHLLETKDGKGPFLKGVPECPSGNRYVIKNGKVIEAS